MAQKHTGYSPYFDIVIGELFKTSAGISYQVGWFTATLSTILTADLLVWLCGSAF